MARVLCRVLCTEALLPSVHSGLHPVQVAISEVLKKTESLLKRRVSLGIGTDLNQKHNVQVLLLVYDTYEYNNIMM